MAGGRKRKRPTADQKREAEAKEALGWVDEVQTGPDAPASPRRGRRKQAQHGRAEITIRKPIERCDLVPIYKRRADNRKKRRKSKTKRSKKKATNQHTAVEATDDMRDVYLRMLSNGLSKSKAAMLTGISRKRWLGIASNDPAFAREVENATKQGRMIWAMEILTSMRAQVRKGNPYAMRWVQRNLLAPGTFVDPDAELARELGDLAHDHQTVTLSAVIQVMDEEHDPELDNVGREARYVEANEIDDPDSETDSEDATGSSQAVAGDDASGASADEGPIEA